MARSTKKPPTYAEDYAEKYFLFYFVLDNTYSILGLRHAGWAKDVTIGQRQDLEIKSSVVICGKFTGKLVCKGK